MWWATILWSTGAWRWDAARGIRVPRSSLSPGVRFSEDSFSIVRVQGRCFSCSLAYSRDCDFLNCWQNTSKVSEVFLRASLNARSRVARLSNCLINKTLYWYVSTQHCTPVKLVSGKTGLVSAWKGSCMLIRQPLCRQHTNCSRMVQETALVGSSIYSLQYRSPTVLTRRCNPFRLISVESRRGWLMQLYWKMNRN